MVSSPVHAPLSTADVTTHPASFGASGRALAISARGLGCSTRRSARRRTTPTPRSTGTRAARRSCTAQVTVTADPAGGTSGGAGLIERDDMTARQALARRCGAVRERQRDDRDGLERLGRRGRRPATSGSDRCTVKAPVGLRLVRRGSTYAGYYSTDQGKTWTPVDTVTVAASASPAAGRGRVPRVRAVDVDDDRDVQRLPRALIGGVG